MANHGPGSGQSGTTQPRAQPLTAALHQVCGLSDQRRANKVPHNNLLFVVFVHGSNEFYPADLLVAPTQNFLKRSSSSSEQEMAEDDDVNMEDEENEDESKHSKRKVPRRAAAK